MRNIEIKNNRKYKYKSNFTSAVTNIRLYLKGLMKEKTLVERIKKFWSPKDQKDHLNVPQNQGPLNL